MAFPKAARLELIGLGRALVADPAWLNKARQGRSHDIRYCLSCNTCWGTIVAAHLPIACVNNPRVGRVDEVDYRPTPAQYGAAWWWSAPASPAWRPPGSPPREATK